MFYNLISYIKKQKAAKDMEPEFLELYDKCKDYTMTSREKMYALYKAVQYISTENIPGDIVECGVWKGGSLMMAAYTLLAAHDTQRKIYLYDTYTGMVKPTEEDVLRSNGIRALGKWQVKQKEGYNEWCYASLEEVQDAMSKTGYPQENIKYIKGRVEDTLPGQSPSAISILRLDTDWYESTKHELVHLFPLLSNQGILILDDYGNWEGSRKATDEYFKEQYKQPLFLSRIDHSGRIGVK